MFILENYNKVIENYKQATGVEEIFFNAEHLRFIENMKNFKMMMEDIEKKSSVSAEEHEKIAYQYSLINRLYREQMAHANVMDERTNGELENECKAIPFMDIHSGKDFESNLSDARDFVLFGGKGASKADEPRIGYMSDVKNADIVKYDLEEDQKLFQELDESFKESKRRVYGNPSPQYDGMEKAYLALKEKNRKLLEEGNYSEKKVDEYKMCLNALTRAAKEYETYKLSNAEKNHKSLKAKEVRRVNTSRLLQKYAGHRASKIENAVERPFMLERIELKLKAIDINREQTLSNNKKADTMNKYASSMLEISKKMKYMPSNNGDTNEFARSILHALGSKTGKPQQNIHTVNKVIMGAYGNLSKDSFFTDQAEIFLKNAAVSKFGEGGRPYSGAVFFNSALGAAKNAERNTPDAFARATGTAVVHLIEKASEMSSIEANFTFLADLAVFASHAEPDKQKCKLNKALMEVVDGLNEASKIVKQGVESWKRMMAVKLDENAKYDPEDMLNFVTMRVLESGMETFCSKNTNKKTNPIFTILGSTENGAEKLKKAIADSTSMKKINEKWGWREKGHLLANKNDDYDKAFSNLMKNSFDKAFDIKSRKSQEASNDEKMLFL